MSPDAAALRGVLDDSIVSRFERSALAELVVLQRCCWVQEAIANDTLAGGASVRPCSG